MFGEKENERENDGLTIRCSWLRVWNFFLGSKWKIFIQIENWWGVFKKRKECERKEWWRASPINNDWKWFAFWARFLFLFFYLILDFSFFNNLLGFGVVKLLICPWICGWAGRMVTCTITKPGIDPPHPPGLTFIIHKSFFILSLSLLRRLKIKNKNPMLYSVLHFISKQCYIKIIKNWYYFLQ